MHRRKKRTKEQVEKAERARHALDLSLQGFGYEEIGEQLQVSKATAWRIIQKEIARIPTTSAESAKKVALAKLDREWRRTDRMLERLDEKFDESQKLDKLVLAISRVQLTRIRIEQRRAALEGTDAPRPAAVVFVPPEPPPRFDTSNLTLSELRQLRELHTKALNPKNILTLEAETTHAEPERSDRPEEPGTDPASA